MKNLMLYIDTIKHLKPSQVFYRVWRRAGGGVHLKNGYVPNPNIERADVSRIPILPELDFDPAFLARFDVDAILDDRVTLLYHEEAVDWAESWHADLDTPLWRFNLHYCEYLLPLAKAFLDTGDICFLEKAKEIVSSWISACTQERAGNAWHPYTISLRIANWLAFYGELREAIDEDSVFANSMKESLALQYCHLARNLEKDILANHYFENIKALLILACFFDDKDTLKRVLPILFEQVDEQILPDGMHYELSPMYHKIILEDLMRIATVLKAYGCMTSDLMRSLRLQKMCDCLWSIERNVNRTPLVNDSGDNVAKSRDALLLCAKNHFAIEPEASFELDYAGYCILERVIAGKTVKMLFDTGLMGPTYQLGHMHNDALSFECFIDGRPWIVNSGTFAYQCNERLAYRCTGAHSTAIVENAEQNELWASYRVARFGHRKWFNCGQTSIDAAFETYEGYLLTRHVELKEDGIEIIDTTNNDNGVLEVGTRFACNQIPGELTGVAIVPELEYAPEFGKKCASYVVKASGAGEVKQFFEYPLSTFGVPRKD